MITGMLCRGTEKIAEGRKVSQVAGFFERMDYVSIVSMELAFTQAAEGILGFYYSTDKNVVDV